MRSCLPQEEVFQIVGCAIEGLNPWSWNSWEAIRKMHWSWSLGCEKFHSGNSPHSTLSTKARKLVCSSLT